MASTDMDQKLRDEILKSLMWDYTIPITELSNLSTEPYRKQAVWRANSFSSAVLSECRGITLSRSGTARRISSTSIRRKSEEVYEPMNSGDSLISSSDYYEGKGFKHLNGAPRIVKNWNEGLKTPLNERSVFNFEFSFENSLIYMCAFTHSCDIFGSWYFLQCRILRNFLSDRWKRS